MKNRLVFIFLIMFLAVVFRFWDINNIPPGLWADEAMNGNNAVEALANANRKVFYPENFGREGLFINAQSFFVAAFGNEPWALRLPSAIFGALTVLGLYFMTRELFGERVALFSAFFLATSFWHIMFSRIGFRVIMAPFFLVWSFYFLFLGMRKQKEWIFALAGSTFGLGFHTYIAYRIAPLIAIYPLWKFYQNWQLRRPTSKCCAPCLIGLFIFTAFIAALPLLWYYAQNPADFLGRTSAISIFKSPQPLAQFSENFVKTLAMFNIAGDFNWRHNLAGSPQLWWPVGILFLIGVWQAFKNFRWPRAFVLLWFTMMLLPVALSNESLPHALRAVVLIPPAMIFAALGLEYIIKNWKPARPAIATTFLFVFFTANIIHAYNAYFLRWAPNFNVYQAFQADLTDKARWLKAEAQYVKRYVVTDRVDRADTRGTPISFQPIIFIAGVKNIEYLGKSEFDKIDCPGRCVIIPVESRATIYQTLKRKIPGLRLDAGPGFVILRK